MRRNDKLVGWDCYRQQEPARTRPLKGRVVLLLFLQRLGSTTPFSYRTTFHRRRHYHHLGVSNHPSTSMTTTATSLFQWNKQNKHDHDLQPLRQRQPQPHTSAGMYSNLFLFDDEDDDNDDTSTTTATATSTSTPPTFLSTKEAVSWWIAHEAYNFFPIMLPVIAYLGYDPIATLFATCLDILGNSQNNWVAVDGGAYQAKIIAPAINGVVVPAVSILFANLIGTTVSTLRQRQLDIHTCLNTEAGQLRILQQCLVVLSSSSSSSTTSSTSTTPTTASSSIPCQRYLAQYVTRLIAESQPSRFFLLDGEHRQQQQVQLQPQWDDSLDTELNAVWMELAQLGTTTTTVNGADNKNNRNNNYALMLSQAHSACSRLYDERAKRISALKEQFPPLHFGILAALALSICVAFLLETKQDILVFLNAIQLRILWSMLVGTFTALGIVCYDLSHPFQGSYQINNNTVQQLYSIRKTLLQTATTPTTTTTKATTTTSGTTRPPASSTATTTESEHEQQQQMSPDNHLSSSTMTNTNNDNSPLSQS